MNDSTLRFRLDGKSALITGAGRGIGRACAIALSEAGAEVMLVSRTIEELEEVAAEITAGGGTATTFVCDVTNAQQVVDLFSRSAEIDVLVNSAGGNIPEPFVEVSEDHFDQLLSLNLRSVFLVTQAAAKSMIANRREGSIVTISSQMGHVGAKNRTIYCATKHAVEGFTKALAIEMAEFGIRVNTVAPTFIQTSMTQSFLSDKDFNSEIVEQIPLGRLGTTDDVVGAVLYLASSAASLTTGSSILVDGGWTSR